VFISGHSLTDNPLADHLLTISASLGTDLQYNQQIGIGSPIRVRTKGGDTSAAGWPGYSFGKNRDGNNMNVVAELRSPQTLGVGEVYDTLVLTERHDLINTVNWENTVGYARHYVDRLLEGNANAETQLFHCWLDIDKTDPTLWLDHETQVATTWECVAAKINQTLELNGRSASVKMLPAGGALVALVQRLVANEVPGITGTLEQRLSTIFSDNVHMTNVGSYYIALVTYAAVFRRTPVGAEAPSELDANTAAFLQNLAWTHMQDYWLTEATPTITMAQCRSHTASQVCASFGALRNEPQHVTGCQNTFNSLTSDQNPFVDETSYTPLPAP